MLICVCSWRAYLFSVKCTSEHDRFMHEAIRLSAEAASTDNFPYGAVLDGEIVCRAYNEVLTTNDITVHAELLVIRKGSVALPAEDLSRAILYASTEPCAMCAGAICWAGTRTVVYGC